MLFKIEIASAAGLLFRDITIEMKTKYLHVTNIFSALVSNTPSSYHARTNIHYKLSM